MGRWRRTTLNEDMVGRLLALEQITTRSEGSQVPDVSRDRLASTEHLPKVAKSICQNSLGHFNSKLLPLFHIKCRATASLVRRGGGA